MDNAEKMDETKSVISVGLETPRSESFSSLPDELLSHGLMVGPEGKVLWLPGSREHPRHWSLGRKVYDSGLIIFFDFFTTAVSTSGAAAGEQAQAEFGLTSITSTLAFVSIYLLGQCVGSIVFPPYSESFGRRKLYIVSAALYSAFCIVVGAAPSIAGVVIGRFVTGLLSAIPSIVVAGSIEDMWDSDARVWLIFAWSLFASLGLVVGPIMSTYLIAGADWTWIYYSASIVLALTTVLMLGIRESRPSLILRQKVELIRARTGDTTLFTSSPDHMPNLRTFARIGLFRPVRLFFTEIIVFVVAVMSAIGVAFIYLFTEAIPLIYSSYDLTMLQRTLPFVTIGVGLCCSILTRCYDHWLLQNLKAKGLPIKPENKLTGLSLGAPALAIGLWWFAWTIQPAAQLSWVIPTAALVLVGYAINEFDIVLAGYLADSYLSYAASGFGALAMLRSLLCAGFPLFAKRMFLGLDNNKAATVLAALATVFCVVPPLFTRYGERIRKRSEFASWSLAVEDENIGRSESTQELV